MYEYLTTESLAKRAKNLEKGALTVTFSPPSKFKSSVQSKSQIPLLCFKNKKGSFSFIYFSRRI